MLEKLFSRICWESVVNKGGYSLSEFIRCQSFCIRYGYALCYEMNFQCDSPLEPLRVLIVNSMSPSAKFLAIKILSGVIFGHNQLINLTLMVYSNEQSRAIGLKFELEKCAFLCTNSIEVSSALPSISDADVFCFLTNFPNPNVLNFANMNNERQLDMLNLIINIANNFQWPEKEEKSDEKPLKRSELKKKILLPEKKPRKPILVTDGLVSMDILMSVTKNLPSDIFFCSTPIPALAKSVLGGHLKVLCNVLNEVLVWAANDEIFHVEFEKPLIIHDRLGEAVTCDWDTIGKDLLASINLDHTQFNPSWLKKDLILKILLIAQKNPYGSIYKAAALAETLQRIWLARQSNEKFYANMGVISDGSLETIKGYPYVLPVVFTGDSWSVNTRFAEGVHLKQEIKRMNKATKVAHQKLIPFCLELLHDSDDSTTLLSVEDDGSQNESVFFSSTQCNDNETICHDGLSRVSID